MIGFGIEFVGVHEGLYTRLNLKFLSSLHFMIKIRRVTYTRS